MGGDLEPGYARLAVEALRLWRDFERDCGRLLLVDCGRLNLVKASVTPDLASTPTSGSGGIEQRNDIRIGRHWDRLAGLPENGDVFSHGRYHQLLCLLPRAACGYHTRQVRGVHGIPVLVVSFENDHVTPHDCSFRRPACRRMLASVFSFRVALGLPATVTSPGLLG